MEALKHTLPIAWPQDFIYGPSLLDKHRGSYFDNLDAESGPIVLVYSHGRSCAAGFRNWRFVYAA